MTLYYQIDYVLTKVPKGAAYFHAQFRRTNPVKEGDVYTILDNVSGTGPVGRNVHGLGNQPCWLVG